MKKSGGGNLSQEEPKDTYYQLYEESWSPNHWSLPNAMRGAILMAINYGL